MAPPKFDPTLLPLVVSGPFGKGAPHEKVAAMEKAICEALTAALALPSGQRFVTRYTISDKAYRKSDLNLLWGDGPNGLTEVRLRVNGMVKRGGVEMIGVSVACLAGSTLSGWSEDLSAGSASKSGALLIAGAEGPVAIDEALRARVAAKPASSKPAEKPAPTTAPSTTRRKTAKESPAPHRLIAEARIRGMAVSNDGKWIATTHEDQHVVLWDAETGRPRWSKRAGGNGMLFVRAVAFSPDGKVVASGASGVKGFDVATGAELEGWTGHPKGELRHLAWGDEGLLTVSAKPVLKADNSFALWDPAGPLRGQWKWEMPEQAAFVPGALLVSGYRDSRTQAVLTRFDTQRGKVTAEVSVANPFFCPTSRAVWTEVSEGEVSSLGLETLERRASFALEGAVLVGASDAGVHVSSGAVVQRRDERGRVSASFTLPALEDAAPILDVANRGNRTRVLLEDLTTVRSVVTVQDRVFCATDLTLSIWSTEGAPISMPQVSRA